MRLAFLGGVILILNIACGGGGTPTQRPAGSAPAAGTARPAGTTAASPAAGGAATCTGSGGTAVTIQNFAFSPATATVAVGSTVTWTNDDSTAHTVTFDAGPNCGQLSSGATTTATFSAAGSYAYHCSIHPSMKGTVVVQ